MPALQPRYNLKLGKSKVGNERVLGVERHCSAPFVGGGASFGGTSPTEL
jgi:hypothetical protein